MNTRKLTLLFTALVGLAVSAFAQSTATEATVAQVTGAATVTLPDGTTTPLSAGMKVAQGATITTGADGDVFLESHPGYVTAIKGNSVVTVDEISVTSENGQVKEEKTLLDLKSGNLVAKLDPKKKSVNNYQVRTPKGVAAARGTIFTVKFNNQTFTIAVVNGEVTLGSSNSYSRSLADIARSVDSLAIASGQYFQQGVAAVNTRDTSAARRVGKAFTATNTELNELRELLAVAVATVALAAQNNIGGTTAKEAADLAATVFKAVPSAAGEAAAILNKSGVKSGAVTDAITGAMNSAGVDTTSFTNSLSTGTFEAKDTRSSVVRQVIRGSQTTTTPEPIDTSTISRSN